MQELRSRSHLSGVEPHKFAARVFTLKMYHCSAPFPHTASYTMALTPWHLQHTVSLRNQCHLSRWHGKQDVASKANLAPSLAS
jgi:hypothetical protein